MVGGKYSQGQIKKQKANAVKKQKSIPTGGYSNKTRMDDEYNQVDTPLVPSEPRGFDRAVYFLSQYAGWITWTITLATAIGTFLNFQGDLKRAESDIKSNKLFIEKNSDKHVTLEKVLVEQNKDISYVKIEVSDIEESLGKVSSKINSVSERQVALEYSIKSEVGKKNDKD